MYWDSEAGEGKEKVYFNRDLEIMPVPPALSGTDSRPPTMTRLKDILQQQRKRNFVGRLKELEFFDQVLKENSPACHLIYIQGSGGQGKTTLLKQFTDACNEQAIPFFQLDCRYIESHPDSFKQSLQAGSPFEKSKDLVESIEKHKGIVILFIDTY